MSMKEGWPVLDDGNTDVKEIFMTGAFLGGACAQ
jgi:hypothetical protein